MLSAPMPENETKRLIDLLQYKILDTPEEDEFNDIVELASSTFKAPVALVSLLDTTRQWFKAKVGMEFRETSRSISFCGHAIQSSEVFVIPDALSDERFADNPLVTSPPYVRFYAGAPLISTQGFALGTLCINDYVPRHFSDEDKKILRKLSKQVVKQLELRRVITEKNELLRDFQELSRLSIEREEKLRYMEKLELLKEMSQGLCHEINNPLAVILLGAGAVKKSLEASEPERFTSEISKLKRILSNASRIEKIVSGLRLYSSMEEHEKTNLLLKEVVEDALGICKERFNEEGISVEVINSDERSMKGNRGQLMQVVHDLLLNSLEAIRKLPVKWIKIVINSDSHFHNLRVIDSGPGIPLEVQKKLMQPFFTTKEVGKGSGLGLPICRGIVEEHQGTLHYENFSGNTSFVLSFPLTFLEN